MPFHVLLVCTANQCRSPIAEHILRQRLSDLGLPLTAGSAGTHARGGEPIHPLAEQVLRERSIEVDDWRSQRVTPALIERADVVLTAATAHRRNVVALVPQAAARTFTIVQFARYAAAVDRLDPTDPEHVGIGLLSAVQAVRGDVQPVAAGADDLLDPIGRPIRAFRACRNRLEASIDELARLLAPAASRP
ncbi:MAG: protein tyrosine phosphatase [Pseudonocardiales bacterium]|nr:protein tyrosine phosphatase [Pseudonocardiales bacterium]